MTEKNATQTATAPRPIVTTKRSLVDSWAPRCPRCGAPMDGWDPMGLSEELCHSCTCIEIEIADRRRQVYA